MIAYYNFSIFQVLCIEEILHHAEDYVRFYELNTETNKRGRMCKSKIQYTSKGSPYFIHNKQRIYLDECMKCNLPT